MVGIAGVFEFSIGEVKEIIQGSIDHFRKDRTSLCVYLDVINMSLLDWHSDIVDKFSHWEVYDMEVKNSDLELISKCAGDATRKSIAEQSEIFLKNVETLYNADKGDKLEKKLKSDLDIDKITKQALPAIKDFYERTSLGKDEFLDGAHGGIFTKELIEKAKKWKHKLKEDVEVVNKSLTELRYALKCEPTSEDQLRRYRPRK
jgi:hypothetical protein